MWGFLNGAALNTGLDVSVEHMVSPDMHLGVGLPDHSVVLFLVLQGSFLLVFIRIITNLHLHQQQETSVFSLLSPTRTDGDFFEAVSSDWCQVNLVVVLICIFLRITNMEHLFL